MNTLQPIPDGFHHMKGTRSHCQPLPSPKLPLPVDLPVAAISYQWNYTGCVSCVCFSHWASCLQARAHYSLSWSSAPSGAGECATAWTGWCFLTGIGSLVWEDSDRGQHPPGDARSWWAQHYRFYACATQIASFPIFSASNFYLLRSPGDSDTKHSECSLGLPPIV